MLAWALHTAGIEHIIHYLDDFLFLVAPNTEKGLCIWQLAYEVIARLGIPVTMHKTEGPAVVILFLGILINTVAGEPLRSCSNYRN
jgi:hypothetical protein